MSFRLGTFRQGNGGGGSGEMELRSSKIGVDQRPTGEGRHGASLCAICLFACRAIVHAHLALAGTCCDVDGGCRRVAAFHRSVIAFSMALYTYIWTPARQASDWKGCTKH